MHNKKDISSVLKSVSKPGRYIGGEYNSIIKDKNEVDCRDALRGSKEAYKKPAVTVIDVETDGKNPKHKGIINNFTAAILGKEPLFVDGRDGIHMVELMNAIEYSGWHGGIKVDLPVDEDLYLKELNEHRATSRIKDAVEAKVTNTDGSYDSTI